MRSTRSILAMLIALAGIGTQAEEAADGDAKTTATIAAAIENLAPAGWDVVSPIERFVVGNLYDKINGRSELHMSYGVKGLAWVSLGNTAKPEHFVDVFLYDMGSVEGAFGIYSVERWPGSPAVDVGRMGYHTDTDFVFWKGPYYATLVMSEEDPDLLESTREIAKTLAKRLDDSGDDLWGFSVLPETGRVADSIQFFKADALSLSFLSDTYTADYKIDGATLIFFVSRQATNAAAAAVLSEFVEYMKRYGEGLETLEESGLAYRLADMGGERYDVVAQRGSFVGGMTAVEGRDAAVAAAKQLIPALQLP